MNYQTVARQAALQAGIDPVLFARQINQESGFNPRARSGAGATGIAQFMPATARGEGINPNDPVQALHGAARLMARYVKQFGSYRKALIAYNWGPGHANETALPAETQQYIKNILGGHDPGASAGQTMQPVAPGGHYGLTRHTTTKTDVNQALIDSLLEHPKSGLLKSAASAVASGAYTTSKTSYTGNPTPGAFKAGTWPLSASGGGRGGVSVSPTANRPGHGIVPEVLRFANQLAGTVGGFTIGTGTNHNRLTVNGNVSDHWDGHAIDIPVAVDSHRGDQITAAALMQAGVPANQARQMARSGGLFNVTMGGHRVQIIWKTNEGGNHHNHVHIGIR